MPELKASGDIFTADGQAGFDEGIVAGRVGGGARLPVGFEVDLCHGLSVSLSAQALAEISGELRLLRMLLGEGQGQGLAAAGATAGAHLSGDLFDTFGLRSAAAAYAELSLAGRVAVGFEVQELARLARDQLDDVAYDLLVAFLNEAEVKAGVWGKVSAAAMARAHLNICGSLRDDDSAGFVIEHGAEVAWATGGGYEFYCGIGLENPKRFFGYAADRVTRELVLAARQSLPPELQPATAVLGFVLPLTLNSAYELGQTTAFETLGNPDQLTAKFCGTFWVQLRKFCLDTLSELGGRLVAGYLQDGIDVVLERDLTQPQREAIRQTAEDLAAFFQARLDARELTVADFTQALGELADLLTALLPAQTAEWRQALTLAWVALASAETVRAGLSSLSGSWSVSAVGGFEDGDAGEVLVLPEPPDLVAAELKTVFGALPPRLEFSHAVGYLVGQGLGPMLGAALPELDLFFDSLAAHTGLTPGDLIASGLQATITTDLSQTEVYRALRDFVREHVDGALTQELLPALRAQAQRANNTTLLKWLDEAAEPGLLLLSGFVFERLDAAVAGTLTGDLSPLTHSFRTALNILVGRLVNLNVIVIADITLNFVVDNLHRGLRELAATVRTDASHAVALAAPQFFGALLPAGPLLPQAVSEASRELAADLVGAAADGFGPAVWTTRRKAELLDTFQALLESVDGNPDFADRPALEQFLAEVAECNYLPNGDRLVRLLVLQAEVLAAAVEATLPQTLDALERFALRVTLGIFEAWDDAIADFLDDLEVGLTALWNAYQAAAQWLADRVAELQAAASKAATDLEAAADVLRDAERRQEVLDRLLAIGITRAQQTVRALPGFDLQPADWQANELAAAAAGFTVTLNAARPVFDAALAVLAPLADGLGDVVSAAASLPDLVQRLGDKAARLITDAANKAMNDFGLSLPKELSVSDIVDSFRWLLDHSSVVRDALRAALTAAEKEASARQRRQQALAQRDQARQAHASAADGYAAAVGQTIEIRIDSPLPFDPGSPAAPAWTYGREVPVVIEVAGATPAFVDPAQPQRLFVAVNGVPVNVPRSRWRATPDGAGLFLEIVLSTVSTPLRAGMNVLECSVAAGARNAAPGQRRASVAFVLSPQAAPLPALVIDPARSVFHAPSSDPQQVLEENIVIHNRGATALNLTGWRLTDRRQRTFVFPTFRLPPGRTVSVHTGQAGNTSTHLYWGQRRAVWNKASGIVHLIDGQGVLAAFSSYRKA